ncbi:MAG TPA: tetratricopeptide repeat protein [Anaerolineales bacterium]|nr:tetratricopeptide repeat protein [Anaerolineales bacterium]
MSEHELWNELGNLYFLSGQYQQAMHAYRRSIELDRNYGRPYSNLALTYVQQGKYDEAIDLYRRSIELLAEDKEKALTYNRLGNVFRHVKDYQQAVVAYRSADALDPESEDGSERPGWATAPAQEKRPDPPVAGETPLAIDEPFPYAKSEVNSGAGMETDSGSTSTWAPFDPSLFQESSFSAPEAGTLTTWGAPNTESEEVGGYWPPEPGKEEYFTEFEEEDRSGWPPAPEDRPMDELEYSLEAVDLAAEIEEPPAAPEPAEGARIFEEAGAAAAEPKRSGAAQGASAMDLQPAMSERRTSLPAAQRGNGASAALDIEIDERQRPELPAVEAHAGQLAASKKDERAANPVQAAPEATGAGRGPVDPQRDAEELREIQAGLAKFKRVTELNPKNARAWDTLGNLYKSAGQYREALLAYQQAIENDPSRALYHHHMGLVFACEGRTDEAIEAFQRVIQLDPDHALAHAALGGYYRKKGLEELAQKHVGIAMKNIFDSENEYNRACLAAICGNTDQALELLRVALRNKQTYVDWILRDPDLDFIRQDPRFKQLISDYAR